ncbi:hypothetical protein [Mucilaginibacter ginsenosidivorans]|uniref:Uncharacterized protein n=1 Tax=Mucilaginibacter ginsenosidivorans TaxID=398053 RepID=A0A5B8UUQ3_9SPHI|nr:hypothetical protein [Mucilaginibacter ginsenosidivorans]QEC62061.1 hypothetical protein FRZ54_05475 [Mucilaginibacter ginsenosidivorans]
MTPRSLFAIIIKIIGFYLLLGAVVSIPQTITALFSFKSQFGYGSADDILTMGFFLVFSVSFHLAVMYYCIFKTEWIIDKLQLDQNFSEEKFEFSIHRSTVLRIAVIVIGGVMIADSLPLLCKQVFVFIRFNRTGADLKQNPETVWMIFYFVKFSAGFVLLSSSRPIVNFIELKRKKPAQEETTE